MQACTYTCMLEDMKNNNHRNIIYNSKILATFQCPCRGEINCVISIMEFTEQWKGMNQYGLIPQTEYGSKESNLQMNICSMISTRKFNIHHNSINWTGRIIYAKEKKKHK